MLSMSCSACRERRRVWRSGEDIGIVDLVALPGALHGALTDLLHELLTVGHGLAARNLFVAKPHGRLKAGNALVFFPHTAHRVPDHLVFTGVKPALHLALDVVFVDFGKPDVHTILLLVHSMTNIAPIWDQKQSFEVVRACCTSSIPYVFTPVDRCPITLLLSEQRTALPAWLPEGCGPLRSAWWS